MCRFSVHFLHELIVVVEIDDFLVGLVVNNDFLVVTLSLKILEGFDASEEKEVEIVSGVVVVETESRFLSSVFPKLFSENINSSIKQSSP